MCLCAFLLIILWCGFVQNNKTDCEQVTVFCYIIVTFILTIS
uniref:G-protein coupled receptors family 3 profile domain-containing protein n=1 Tax=Anguilla anguilla TaxID=7936 RepID=A0A0E9WBZ3_ANGAN